MTEYVSCLCGDTNFRTRKHKDGSHVLECVDCGNDHSTIKILDLKESSILYWDDEQMANEKDKTLQINTERDQLREGNIQKSIEEKKEGWFKLFNATKWHYFVDGESLCRKWFNPSWKESTYEQGNENSPSNCKVCLKKLLKRRLLLDV